MPCNGIQNALRDRLNLREHGLCIYCIIFGEDQGKSYRLLRVKTKTRERDIRCTKGDEFPLLLSDAFLCPCAAGIHDGRCRFFPLRCGKLFFEKCAVAGVVVAPEERLQILPFWMPRIAHVIEMVQFLLSLVPYEHGNTACPLAHCGMQQFPCRCGRICLVRRAPVKEQPDLRVDRVPIVFCHRAEKVDESVFVEAQIGKEPPALLHQCVHGCHSVSLLP